MHLALLSLDVRPGDEIIVPSLTYIATANAVNYCSAIPVFVDSEPTTMNIDPLLIEKSITENTKGIIVVHLYGHMADMDPILELADKYGLFVVEDAAEAHGALYKGKKAGSFGDVATFSFYGNKIITTGEGGMVITNRSDLAKKIRLLRGQGMDPQKRYWFPIVGYNYRMTNIQAAIGLGQLEKIDHHLRLRRQIAEWYNAFLDDLNDYIILPVEKDWANHSYWMYTILLKESVAVSRDVFMEELSEFGIETRPVFFPIHSMPPYCHSKGIFPVAEKLARNGINLPTHGLLTQDEVLFITEKIRYILKKQN